MFERYLLSIILFVFSTQIFCQNYCNDTIIDSQSFTCAKFKGDPGGEKFINFIEKTIKYPKSARNHILTGCVKARFVVNINGDLTNIEIVQSLRDDYDNAVIEALKHSPKWIPAMHNEKPIPQLIYFPVSFHKNRKDRVNKCL